MKKLISFFVFIAFMSVATGAPTRNIQTDTIDGILSQRNYIKNSGFEGPRLTQWTASAGTLTAISTAADLESGSLTGSWAATGAAARTLDSSNVTVTSGDGLSGQNGVVSCKFKAGSGTATHTLTAFDGTNNLATPTTVTSSTTRFSRTSVNFIYPASGTVKLRISSVSAAEPTLFIDSCYMGLADGFNIGSVSQAVLVGTFRYAPTAGCMWSMNSTSFSTYVADGDCPTPTVTGELSYAGSKIPGFTIASVKPGRYYFVTRATFLKGGAPEAHASFQLYDGTNAFGEQVQQGGASSSMSTPNHVAGYTYETAQSNVTFQFRGRISNTSAFAQIIVDSTSYANAGPFEVEVYRYPTTSETVYRADQLGSSWSGYHDSTCSFTRTNTAYGDYTADATCALVETSNNNFGTVSTSGSVLPAITFTPKRTGRYMVIARTTPGVAVAGANGAIQMTDGTNTLDQAGYSNGASYLSSVALFGTYNATSTAAATIKLQGKSSSGAMDITGAFNGMTVSWTVIPLDQSMPAPVLVGSVSSSSAGQERIERVKFGGASLTTNCTSTPCASVSQSGSWITSVTWLSAGNYRLDIAAGIFTATPTCVLTPDANSVTGGVTYTVNGNSATQIGFSTYTAAGSPANSFGGLICMGPR